MAAPVNLGLDFATLRRAYRTGEATPEAVVREVYRRIAARGDDHVWIHTLSLDQALAYAKALAQRRPQELPLYGLPFAIKDNIDLAGHPTTAACPAFSYTAERSAFVVQRLIDAGAIPIGKTNLDQFAAGLVGVRSPHGAPSSVFDARTISGGSSSGSAVAVAAGVVSFSLGTDTAGSGRVPAAFNNIVGLKPSRGALSTSGVVPACRSLDCVSIFALTVSDAQDVLRSAAGFDAADPYSRAESARAALDAGLRPPSFSFGVPRPDQLEFFGNAEYARLFGEACARFEALGGRRVEIDFQPFAETAQLLYQGPWLAERTAAIDGFLRDHAAALHPVTRAIVEKGREPSAVDAFKAFYRLEALRREADAILGGIEALLLPTAGTIYTIAQVEADPVALNTNLGRYTNFVNLLDLCGVAVPAGFTPNGLPFGVTLLAPRHREPALLALGDALHRAASVSLGGTGAAMPEPQAAPAGSEPPPGWVRLCVNGAHMSGLPLNPQLASRGARFVREDRTAPLYRLYALTHLSPPRPGLLRVDEGGASIALEVWELPESQFGGFVMGIPGPLGIGTITLADGSSIKGFIGEPYALTKGEDITGLGGWRAFLEKARR